MSTVALIALLIGAGLLAFVLLAAFRAYLAWVVPLGGLLLAWGLLGSPGPAFWALTALYLLLAIGFGVPILRRQWLTGPVMPLVEGLLPKLAGTERIALDSGTVWFEGEIFSGRPDVERLLRTEYPGLSEAEQAFLEGPVERLCAAVTTWDVQQSGELSDEAWRLIREHRFFGMVIPEAYGGLEFSAAAHSAVVARLGSRSATLAVTVMVPNSLGPAELLMRYGTDEQRDYWLPRLARAEEIPCFALTETDAGSDAAATESVGVVEWGHYRGERVRGIRLNWEKRYTTLAPVATVFGLAFRLYDPHGMLGDTEDLGITCALVPADLPGIERGERHDPLGIPFQNGPSEGHDVFVPLDAIIGGPSQAGNGWRMLMETLAAGRGISLPSNAVGGAQLALRVVSGYGMVREQFGMPIGRFEGIEEPVARIAGTTWLMDAMRRSSVAAVDLGERPSVLSGMAKCYLTYLMRDVVADAMDVRAGAAIVRGPRNILAMVHQAVPIGITVEGANILTRSLIVYGQGALRCHPYLLDEIEAIEDGDVPRFDEAFFNHLGHPFSLAARGFLLALTEPSLRMPPRAGSGPERVIERFSAAFALVSEAAVVTLGASLKRRERITGRMADALAWLTIASAAAKAYVERGRSERDLPYLTWGLRTCRNHVEAALVGVIDNLPLWPVRAALKAVLFPRGTRVHAVDDELETKMARDVMDDPLVRDALTDHVFVPPGSELGLGELEDALVKVRLAQPIEKRLRHAVRDGELVEEPEETLYERALAAGRITDDELERLQAADAARVAAVAVDAFAPESYPAARAAS